MESAAWYSRKVSGSTVVALVFATLAVAVGFYATAYVVFCEESFRSFTAGRYAESQVRLYRGKALATFFKPAGWIHGLYLGMPVQIYPTDEDE